MTVTIQADPVPLRVDDHGVIRIGNSRVPLDAVLAEYRKGASPETIAQEFDTLDLADVYAAIAYALRHANEVAAYLRGREEEATAMREKVEAAGMTWPGMPQTVRERWSRQDKDHHASTGQ
jgi:uncharacterized protein (DUF433 family)